MSMIKRSPTWDNFWVACARTSFSLHRVRVCLFVEWLIPDSRDPFAFRCSDGSRREDCFHTYQQRSPFSLYRSGLLFDEYEWWKSWSHGLTWEDHACSTHHFRYWNDHSTIQKNFLSKEDNIIKSSLIILSLWFMYQINLSRKEIFISGKLHRRPRRAMLEIKNDFEHTWVYLIMHHTLISIK